MPSKKIYLESVGEVTLVKKRGNRHIRLRVNPRGEVKVSMPPWVPYQSGVNFVCKNLDWIAKQRDVSLSNNLNDGDAIGKSHQLIIEQIPELAERVQTRLVGSEVRVRSGLAADDTAVQYKARRACERALRQESEQLLAYRLDDLAKRHGYEYRKLQIKRLTTRWGSCSSQDEIALSYYLVQLPWQLIDYVLLHELVHTVHKHHQADFWQTLEADMPNAKLLRKQLKDWRPTLLPNSR